MRKDGEKSGYPQKVVCVCLYRWSRSSFSPSSSCSSILYLPDLSYTSHLSAPSITFIPWVLHQREKKCIYTYHVWGLRTHTFCVSLADVETKSGLIEVIIKDEEEKWVTDWQLSDDSRWCFHSYPPPFLSFNLSFDGYEKGTNHNHQK